MKSLSEKILADFQVRKTKKQKDRFIELFVGAVKEKDFDVKVEGERKKSRNIVVGDLSKAKIVLSAHYDTAPVLPFPNFITPKNFFIYILYNLLIAAVVFALAFAASFFTMKYTQSFVLTELASLAVCVLFIAILMCGKANKHTANDNTSGVITLYEILSSMNEAQKEKTAFVFFDNEEAGLLGSAAFAKLHKDEMENKLIVNFDCVSDGDNIMVILNKKARGEFEDKIKSAFKENCSKNIIVTKAISTIYPSDQLMFKKNIAVTALKKNKLLGLYLDRIHTKKDTIFDKSNIEYIKDSVLRFIDEI